jgi:hypothetical protein
VTDQLKAPTALPRGERDPVTHWIAGWMDPRARLDDMENIFTLLRLEL